MKIDRFWAIQIAIITALFALLIGSYLFSFGLFAPKTGSKPPPPAATMEATPEASVPAATIAPTLATCTPDGAAPSPTAIGDSLASNDPAQQKSCLEFLQAESRAGDKGADLWLGRAYHNGWGVQKDLKEAAAHYGKAATADEAAIRDSAQQWLLQVEKEQ